jgi:hypothetical protein
LRRHFGAGKKETERGHQKRRERRPFLDRLAIGKSLDQRQQRAQDEEHDTGDDGHVIAGDRKHVPDAGAPTSSDNTERLR